MRKRWSAGLRWVGLRFCGGRAGSSVGGLFLVHVLPPLLALADLVPHPPGPGLWLGVNELEQPTRTRVDARILLRAEVDRGPCRHPPQVLRGRVVKAPVPAEQASDVLTVNRFWIRRVAADWVRRQDHGDIHDVGHGHLDDLQLREHQFLDRQRDRMPVKPGADLDRVTELQPLDEYVDFGPVLGVGEAVPGAFHRDQQVAVGDIAPRFEITAHALAVLRGYDEVDVFSRPAEQIHELARRVAVQPDPRRAHHAQRHPGLAGLRDDPHGLCRQADPIVIRHSIGICWKASLMLMPRRLRYALIHKYQPAPTTTAATVIQNSTGIFDGLNNAPAAMGSFQSSQNITAKKAAEIAPATGMIGRPSSLNPAAGDDS